MALWRLLSLVQAVPNDLVAAVHQPDARGRHTHPGRGVPRHRPALDIGRPREHDLRTILNAILYVDRTSIPWRYLPPRVPTVYVQSEPLVLQSHAVIVTMPSVEPRELAEQGFRRRLLGIFTDFRGTRGPGRWGGSGLEELAGA
ncbi:transposase [Nonomuraea sp. NPDC049028]|uniref:transposase n=1 Tax=Nonomuraea sp. NPDC049028 TaxID=3364348 RepID=UPI003724681F